MTDPATKEPEATTSARQVVHLSASPNQRKSKRRGREASDGSKRVEQAKEGAQNEQSEQVRLEAPVGKRESVQTAENNATTREHSLAEAVLDTTAAVLRRSITVLFQVVNLLRKIIFTLLDPLWTTIVILLCFTVFLFFVYYQLRATLLTGLPSLAVLPLNFALKVPKTVYCSTIGYGCSPTGPTVAGLARTVSKQATQAHDIFDSIAAMGDPANLGLHHVEIWELAVAVVASSNLPSRASLGPDLKELGDVTRDIKDQLIHINAFGINSFSWTLREFKRIERTILTMHNQLTRKNQYKAADIARMLDDLFERLNGNMEKLLTLIEQAIPKAATASQLGGTISESLQLEHAILRENKENTPLWRNLLEKQSWKGKQLRRDLSLAEESIINVKSARENLEHARDFLIRYRDNTAYFKASLTGYHLSDQSLNPEEEVEHLSDIMASFETAVTAAKRGGKPAQSSPEIRGVD